MDKLRVLILEDDADIIELIGSSLGPQFECFAANDGRQGLQLALVGEPDLIICDIMMPVMDGWEFARRVRLFEGLQEVPIVFLSALSSRDHIRNGYELGGALYLTKPINPSRLKRNLELFIVDHDLKPRPKKVLLQELLLPPGERSAPSRPEHPRTPPPPPKPPHTPAMPKAAAYLKPATGWQPNPESTGIRVLIVEDDRNTREMISVALAEHYEVIEAEDGIKAVEHAVRYKPDLFIIDAILPRMTGYQSTVMLRKNRDFYRTPIIMISGKSNPRDQQYAMRLGVTRFLAKPFKPQTLVQAIEEITKQPNFQIHPNRMDMGQVRLEQIQHKGIHREMLPHQP